MTNPHQSSLSSLSSSSSSSQSLQQPLERAKPLPEIWQLLFGPLTAGISYILHWLGFPTLFLISFLSIVGLCYLHKDELSLELLFNWLSRFIVHIFFREYDSRNTHKIPPTGPVIFICNHNNQFLDPAVVQEFSPRPISWLIAAKSYRDPTIGRFARAQRAIPVERPQDLAKLGPGMIYHPDINDPFIIQAVGSKVTGGNDETKDKNNENNQNNQNNQNNNDKSSLSIENSLETIKLTSSIALDPTELDFGRDFGSKFILGNEKNSISFQGETYRIAEIISKYCLRLKPSSDCPPPELISIESPVKYKITPHVDQHVMFKNVWDHLVKGGTVGIFPEGGSHDQTSMLPLKAGVAIMALGSAAQMLDQYEAEYGPIFYEDTGNHHQNHQNNENNIDNDGKKINSNTVTSSSSTTSTTSSTNLLTIPSKFQSVSLIAVGLNYFHGHRFRGRVYAEFGDPFQIPFNLIVQYRKGGPNRIAACNSLLDIIRDQLKTVTISAPSWTQLQVLWAVRRLYQPVGVKVPPKLVVVLIRRFAEGYELVKERKDVQNVVARVQEYNDTLKYYGLRDHQVNITQQSRLSALIKLCSRVSKLVVLAILSIPGLLLNFPIAMITRLISKRKANEALKASSVKVMAKDVIASWKVITALTIVPLVLCTYPLLIATFCKFYFHWSWLTVWGNFIILQPMFMWSAVRIIETGIPILNSLNPLWLAVFPPQSGLENSESYNKNNTSGSGGSNGGNGGSGRDLSERHKQRLAQNPNGIESNHHIRQLRQTRARLRQTIRELVDSLGPMIYGPGFEQLRVFPLKSQNIVPTDEPERLKAMLTSSEGLPVLIPQSIDTSDQDTHTDDEGSINNKKKKDEGKNKDEKFVTPSQTPATSSSTGNKIVGLKSDHLAIISPTSTSLYGTSSSTQNVPNIIKTGPNEENEDENGLRNRSVPVGMKNGQPETSSKKSDLTQLAVQTDEFSRINDVKSSPTSPGLRSSDSDESTGSNEFILGKDGEYLYNPNNQLKELQIDQETIDKLYSTPLIQQSSRKQFEEDNINEKNYDDDKINSSSSLPLSSMELVTSSSLTKPFMTPHQSGAHGNDTDTTGTLTTAGGPKLTTTSSSPSTALPPPTSTSSLLLMDDDTTDEENNDGMVQIDGLVVSQAQQHILLSRSLQPLSPTFDEDME